jgi:septum formation protein
MADELVLASGSETRRKMMEAAGVVVRIAPIRLDEDAIRATMNSEGAHPRDVADLLAEQKARRAAGQNPDAVVIGCDQVLDFEGVALGKAATPEGLRAQLGQMNGQRHDLYSAAVVYEDGRPVWRHVSRARMHMRRSSERYLDTYVRRNWDHVRHSAGGYLIEEEGIRLFSRIEGDTFTILGLPLVELLGYLTLRGMIEG